MTAIHPDALLAAMPNLDAQVACEHLDSCDQPAVWRVRIHGIRQLGDQHCGNHLWCMCERHLTQERGVIEDALRGVRSARCARCGMVVTKVSDGILSVVAL